jgi:hypothetical protein
MSSGLAYQSPQHPQYEACGRCILPALGHDVCVCVSWACLTSRRVLLDSASQVTNQNLIDCTVQGAFRSARVLA